MRVVKRRSFNDAENLVLSSAASICCGLRKTFYLPLYSTKVNNEHIVLFKRMRFGENGIKMKTSFYHV